MGAFILRPRPLPNESGQDQHMYRPGAKRLLAIRPQADDRVSALADMRLQETREHPASLDTGEDRSGATDAA